ncbi:MAG: integrase domain-containing protein [Betaproteobacteria bacterium]|nr:integrase domain-containing protein [Betaproteobacteria bacterium]
MSTKKTPQSGSNGLPPANAHAARRSARSPSDPDVILATLPVGTPDYLRVLGAILKKFNHRHSTKHKGVSFKTMLDRQRLYASFFRELRHHTPYRNLDPRQLANRHIEAMVERWVARGLSTATLHNYLSFLRTYGAWIGKAGMVREPEYYVGSESRHAHRVQVATIDHSWRAKGVDISAKIAEIYKFDAWVAMQLDLCDHFGMRAKEARHFRPHGAVLHRDAANPRDAAAFPECEWFVRISHGTKGGRPRDVPLRTDAQRDLLARAATVVAPGMYVGQPGMTSTQSQSRFYYVIRKFGISKEQLGVVAHGLRHEHVNDAYESDADAPSPVRGGVTRPAKDQEARQRAARLLGHNRPGVTSCYLGRSPAAVAAERPPVTEAVIDPKA